MTQADQPMPRIVVITGANGGLGSVVTQAFLDDPVRPLVFGVGKAISNSGFGDHPSFQAVSAEVANGRQASDIVAGILAQTGGHLDALIHLVGGFAGGQTVDETTDETLDRMFEINFRCAFHLFRAALPAMRAARRGGAILAAASRTAVDPIPRLAAYSASKAALVSLIRTIALEGKPDRITANAILPGTMDTPANRAANPAEDPSRWVQPQQVASLLVHLASPSASQISGAVIPIYGGDL